MFKIKKIIKYPAFTLIEMMTSIFIIILITGIFTANYHTGNKRTDLMMTAQKMVTDIRLAQNNTMGLIRYGDDFPPGGWAVNFNLNEKNKYTIFADLNAPAISLDAYQSSFDYNYRRYNPDEGLEEYGARIITLPQGIEINSLKTSISPAPLMVNVNFLPPDPITVIFDGSQEASWLEITLKDMQDGEIRTVLVNFLGLIEVLD